MRALGLLVILGCGSVADDPPPPKPEPKLGASCMAAAECPTSYNCYPQGCIKECPSNGPGLDHGCPVNGHCYVFDASIKGYCALLCKTDADCKAVNATLVCKSQASTESFGTKICVPP